MNPELSIVLPTYNSSSYVVPTLDSIAAQTLRPLALIIVDNNSADDTFSKITAWADAHRSEDFTVTVLSETKKGASAARNRGLEAVESPWTMFFDSDDLMLPEHAASAIKTANEAKADVVGWDVTERNGSHRRTRHFYTNDIVWNSIFNGGLATQRWMARTELFRKAGGWNDAVRLWDDVELGIRLLKLNPKIVRRKGKTMVEVIIRRNSMSDYSGANYLDRMDAPLRSIAQSAPYAEKWTNLARAIHSGRSARKACQELKHKCDAYMTDILAQAPAHPLLLKAAYRWTAMGLPGAAKILKPFFK